jgi:hypothetical protein
MVLVPPACAVPVTAEANTVLPMAQPCNSGSQSGATPAVPLPLAWTVAEKFLQPPVKNGGEVSNPPTSSLVVAVLDLRVHGRRLHQHGVGEVGSRVHAAAALRLGQHQLVAGHEGAESHRGLLKAGL